MNILMITANDPAGMGIAFTNAINRYTEHTCRLITTQDRYGIDFGKDIHIPDIHDDDFGEVEELLTSADIFHFHLLGDENSHLGPLVIRDFIYGKKLVHHHHGHPNFLINAETYNDKYERLGRRVIVSTPDLLNVARNSTWVPNLVPLQDPLYQPRYESSLNSSPVKICQAPTRKFHKHTDIFQNVMSRLMNSSPEVEQVVIERMDHRDCLFLKRKCHIIFDHMRGWFGISSLESLAQGKPVIAGLDEWNIRCIRKFTGEDELPWQIARDEESLLALIQELVVDHEKRADIGKRSRLFMERCWSEKQALAVLLRIYEEL